MAKTYHAGFMRSITSEVIVSGARRDHLPTTRDDHEDARNRAVPRSHSAGDDRRVFNLARRALAGALDIPDAVLVNTCAFAIGYVEVVERRVTFVCPLKLLRAMRQRRK